MPLADESVNLIVTSPPYFALRSYQDGGKHIEGQIGAEPTPQAFLESLWRVMAECWRVLTPEGSCWVNLGDKFMDKSLMGMPWRFANGCVDGLAGPCGLEHEHVGNSSAYLPSEQCKGLKWILRAEVIWDKPNGLPESVTDRVRRSHEQWFHLVKSSSYFSAIDEIREPHAATSLKRYETPLTPRTGARGMPGELREQFQPYKGPNPLGKLPGSVWRIPTQPLKAPTHLAVKHFAAFPTEWPRRIIQGWCPDGGTVLDPFGGTGTTALVAKALGRTGISVDLSADYCRFAEWRTNDPQQLTKVRAKAAAKQQGRMF